MKFDMIVVASCIFISGLAQANAQTVVSKTSASGVAQEVGRHSRFDKQFKSSSINIAVTKQPENGKISTKIISGPIEERECESNNSVCLAGVGKKNVRRLHVFYTSKKGFRGQDSFSYTRSSSDPTDRFNGSAYNVSLTVN